DYPVVMAGILFGSIMIILGQLLADILYAWANPRIRKSFEG
ncbi:MAG TPA: diguanylate cyclase, partial [bacterium]|nr:diguanylate cyclase [bacterium]